MPVKRKTVRHMKDIFTDFDKNELELIDKFRWNPFDHEPLKNSSEVCFNMRKSVNLDPSRIEAIEKIMASTSKVIIFYNFNYELIELRTFLQRNDISWGEWNGSVHGEIPKTNRWAYLVQYTAGAEGWNCVETDTIIFYSLNYSYRMMEQAAGRIDRINTPYVDLYYYRLRSNSSIDNAIFKAVSHKKNFNESSFIEDKSSR
jgi:superfamily II DNA or RNA helicase